MLIFSLIVLYTEASFLRALNISGYTRITSIILVTYSILLFVLQYKVPITIHQKYKFIRLNRISLLIYCVHPMIALPINNCPSISAELGFLITCFASLTFALAIETTSLIINGYVKK